MVALPAAQRDLLTVPPLNALPWDDAGPRLDGAGKNLDQERSADSTTAIPQPDCGVAGAHDETVDAEGGAEAVEDGTVLDQPHVVDPPDDPPVYIDNPAVEQRGQPHLTRNPGCA